MTGVEIVEPLSAAENLLPRTVNVMAANPTIKTTNSLTTAKYNVFTFLPYCVYDLLHPMKRAANFFYLIVGAGQLWTLVSPTQGSPQAWTSLFVIVCIDLVILAKDDLGRHRADKEANTLPIEIIDIGQAGTPEVRAATWADVKVGEVVRVRSRQAFPADLLLLRGSDPPGQCWVNTKPLDGESDMKLRLAPAHGLAPEEATHGEPLDAQLDWARLKGTVHCEAPNDKVNDFSAELRLEGQLRPLVLTPTNVLLRGCMLQNTDWVLGLVLACGTDTKINFGGAASKEQKMGLSARALNKMISIECSLVRLICAPPLPYLPNPGSRIRSPHAHARPRAQVLFFCILGASVGQIEPGAYPWYLFTGPGQSDNKSNWLILACSYFLTLYVMIPATLFVSGNIIYLVCSYLVMWDLELYHEDNDEPCQVRGATPCRLRSTARCEALPGAPETCAVRPDVG